MIYDIIITIFLVALNGIFVAAEFAIVKVRASQVELKSATGDKTAKISMNIIKNLDAYLSATQLGITLASLALGWIGESVVAEMLLRIFNSFDLELTEKTSHQIAIPLAFMTITVLHIVLGEMVPKSIAIRFSEKTTYALAPALRIFYVIFRPFIWFLNILANSLLKLFRIPLVHEDDSHTEDEIRILLAESHEKGSINQSEHVLLENVFKFDDKLAEQIMIPISKISVIDFKASKENILKKCAEEGYSRYPVYRSSIDKIIGILHTKDFNLLSYSEDEASIHKILRPVYFISAKKKVYELLREFQMERIHMAVVMDQTGSTIGIITMEDIIEELVGEIQDEHDEEKQVENQVPNIKLDSDVN